MLLTEFFNTSLKMPKTGHDKKEKEVDFDTVYWYLIDHDKLHKDYFLKITRELNKEVKSGKVNREHYIKHFFKMVNQGCKEFYKENKLKGDLGNLFPKELRKKLSERLLDYYIEGIKTKHFHHP